jgi:hypothetical protein
MPLNPPALAAGFLAPNLIGTGNVGPGVPMFSLGIAIGVCQYLAIAKVVTVDVGTLGVGTSIFPLIVPSPLLLTSLTSGFASAGLMGILAPKVILGIATGLTTGWLALALLQTNHPSVGVGTGVARVIGPSAVPTMISGFAAAGMVGDGPSRMARAIGSGLDMTFASFLQIGIPIVGSASPVPGGGVGFGTVI